MPIAADTNGAKVVLSPMAMTSRRDRPSCWPIGFAALWLGLGAALATACSVDVSKLRAPKASAADAARDRPAAPDMPSAPDTDIRGSEDVLADAPEPARADVADAVGDLPKSDTADGIARSSDAMDSPDLPSPDEAARDGAVDVNSNRDAAPIGLDGGASTDGGGIGAGGGGDTGGTGGVGGRSGIGGHSGSGGVVGTGGSTGLDPDLVLWYPFDESSGTVAADSSLYSNGNGKLDTRGSGGSATFSTDSQVGSHALSLSANNTYYTNSGGYVIVPALKDLAPDAITIAIWVKLDTAPSSWNWARIFDFGSGTTSMSPCFYLTARATDAINNPVRFGISRYGNTVTSEQRLQGKSALTADVWHHIAVVLPEGDSYTGALYIDGAVVDTNPAMTLHLSDLAITTNNWLGRSQFSSDPFINGSMDDFRVYRRALSQEEITALYALR